MENQEFQTAVQEDPTKQLIELIAPILRDIQKEKMAVQKFKIEKDTEIEQAKFTVIKDIDNRDKWYKLIVVFACLGALCVVAFIDKLQGVSPIIGVIIGSHFKQKPLQTLSLQWLFLLLLAL